MSNPKQPKTTTKTDIRIIREALLVAANAIPAPIWECQYALPAFERIAGLIDHYVPKVSQ